MDKSVLTSELSPEERERLITLSIELEGLELAPLLLRSMQIYNLSGNQVAEHAGMDESAFHKILNGDYSGFLPRNANLLIEDLLELKIIANPQEAEIWRRAMRVANFLYYGDLLYQDFISIENIDERKKALKDYLREEYPDLVKSYDDSGGQYPPVFIPLLDSIVESMNNTWEQHLLVATQGNKPGRKTARFIEPELVHIPAGYFWMGSVIDEDEYDSDADAFPEQKPLHRLYLPEFWIGRYPITNAEFEAFIRDTAYETTREVEDDGYTWQHPRGMGSHIDGKENHPVRCVSWNDAIEYCRWLRIVSGTPYSLPSEAEWEKAARGPSGLIYPWGNSWDASRSNTVESGIGDTTPVGTYAPLGDSPYGCADMSGNVWEWTRSLWGKSWQREWSQYPYPYVITDGREDLHAGANILRVLRGGSYDHYRGYAHCAYRSWGNPDLRDLGVGFRVVISPSVSGF